MKKSKQILDNLKEIRELLKSFGLTWSRVYTEKRSFGYRCKFYLINSDISDFLVLEGILENLNKIIQLKHPWCFSNVQLTSNKYASKIGVKDLVIYYYNLD